MKYRKTLAVSTSFDRYKDSLSNRFSSSSYGYEYAKERSNKASEDFDKAMEESKVVTQDFLKAAAGLKEARGKVTPYFPEDALISMKQLDDVATANAKKEKAKEESKK